VSPEDDAEVRHLSITNTGSRVRDIEVTSYCELMLAPPAADAAHQAFSKLFVQTEYVARVGAILATRRKRSPNEPEIWAAHHAVIEGEVLGPLEFETDRARFLGRGREARAPIAVMDGRRLSNSVGTVLDPIFALRCRVRVPPGATTRVSFWTGVAESRGQILDLLDKHHDPNAFPRACTLAWTQAQVQLRHLGITAAEAGLFQRLAGHVLYADASLRPSSDAIRRTAAVPRRSGVNAFPVTCRSCCCGSTTSRTWRRAAVAAGARILAPETARRGSRDLERARRLLRAGSAGCVGGPGADEPDARTDRPRWRERGGIHSAHGPDSSGDTRRTLVGRARRPRGPAREPG
jgi:hypothetical protein